MLLATQLSPKHSPGKLTFSNYVIGVVVFIGVPALIMIIAPVTRMTFVKHTDGVSVQVTKCMFFIIPFLTQNIRQIVKIEEHLVKGRKFDARERRLGHKGSTVDDGTIFISGHDGVVVRVSVDPSSMKDAVAKANAFLNQPTPQPLTITVVANWIVSIVVGGIATFFSLLYIIGATLGAAFGIIRLLSPEGDDLRRESEQI